MALCIEEFLKNSMDFKGEIVEVWNLLEDPVLFTTSDAFLFLDNSYYFRMLKKVIDDLIPTGVMNYLIEKHYVNQFKIQKLEENPKVLCLDDLLFGFKIWIGSCLISSLTFISEQLARLKKRFEKDKLNPSDDRNNDILEEVEAMSDVHVEDDNVTKIDSFETDGNKKSYQDLKQDQNLDADLHLDILDLLDSMECKLNS